MAWHLQARLTESCSCNMFCPCWFGVQELMIMDQGWCGSALAFQVDEGRSDGVDLAGRTVVIGIHFPGPTLFDGNATARVYIDEATSDDQARQLEAIFSGQRGGPMEILSGLVSTWLPAQKVAISVSENDDNVDVEVAGAGTVHSKLLRDGEGHGFSLRGGGFIAAFGMDEANLAPTTGSRWEDPDLPLSFETRSGARGVAVWSG